MTCHRRDAHGPHKSCAGRLPDRPLEHARRRVMIHMQTASGGCTCREQWERRRAA